MTPRTQRSTTLGVATGLGPWQVGECTRVTLGDRPGDTYAACVVSATTLTLYPLTRWGRARARLASWRVRAERASARALAWLLAIVPQPPAGT